MFEVFQITWREKKEVTPTVADISPQIFTQFGEMHVTSNAFNFSPTFSRFKLLCKTNNKNYKLSTIIFLMQQVIEIISWLKMFCHLLKIYRENRCINYIFKIC